jgi:hypothetical protein
MQLGRTDAGDALSEPTDLSPDTQPSPLRRLLQLTWRYRSACVGMFALQVLLLGLSLGGLSLSGLCIDVLREALDPSAPAAVWPAGLEPPGTVEQSLLWIGAGVLICGALHALLSRVYALLSGRVPHLQLVPELR